MRIEKNGRLPGIHLLEKELMHRIESLQGQRTGNNAMQIHLLLLLLTNAVAGACRLFFYGRLSVWLTLPCPISVRLCLSLVNPRPQVP